MFCFQCEQTADAKGCTTVGVCGKTPEVAHLQDATVHALKALSAAAHAARSVGVVHKDADRQLLHVMFATLTNVNFDAAYFVGHIPRVLAARDALLADYRKACAAKGVTPGPVALADWKPADMSKEAMEKVGVSVGVMERRAVVGEEASGLQELITYGLKVRGGGGGRGGYPTNSSTCDSVCPHDARALPLPPMCAGCRRVRVPRVGGGCGKRGGVRSPAQAHGRAGPQ